jgi:type I restriction enzyme S subunit
MLQNDHTSLRVGMVRDRGIITSAYLALRVNTGVSPDFGFQFLNVWDMSKAISRLRARDFAKAWTSRTSSGLPVALPPPAEQAAIVRFLDWASGRLERAIRAKRKVIALLNEQKQAIIHRAVTRGLDPSVPLKPSGIPWLGDIPQHWDVIPLKRTCSLVRDGTHLPPARTPTGFPLLSVRNMVGGRLVRRPDDSFISKTDFDMLNRSFVVRPQDVLMAIVGATLGKVAVVEDIGPFQLQRSVSILRPRPEVMAYPFLATFLRSAGLQEHLWKSVAFSAQPGIYLGFVANEREIDLLREYRTRLVADVVTGKLDVREAAARLPDEAPPDIADDDPDLDEETEPGDEEAAA